MRRAMAAGIVDVDEDQVKLRVVGRRSPVRAAHGRGKGHDSQEDVDFERHRIPALAQGRINPRDNFAGV